MRKGDSMQGGLRVREQRRLIIGFALILGMLLLRAHFRLAVVVGTSMLPTLAPWDLMVVDKRAYANAEPQRGDIVLARDGMDMIVKRIVGLPGEEVEVSRGLLYINGVLQPENYAIEGESLDVDKSRLLDGDFATLGDNRGISVATAVHPVITKADIFGKVVFSSGKKI
jgi:signal peptidase I